MRKIFTIMILISFNLCFAQQANTYFPSNLGFVWNYKVTPLDSLNNPITQLEFYRKDSLALNSNHQGRLASFVLSKEGPSQTINSQPYVDTNFYSFEGTNAFEYFSSSGIQQFLIQLDSLRIDTNFNFVRFFKSLENWYSVYRFAANQGSAYTLLQRDTTISTFRIRFKYSATRNADQTINTEIGSFTCKKFTTQWEFSYILGIINVPLFSIEDTVWIAPNNWMVRAFQPSKSVDLSLLGIPPFNIQGRRIDVVSQIVNVKDEIDLIENFILFQNYPNPFNPSTKISWYSPQSGWHSLKVYDILGREVVTLINEYKEKGFYEIELDLSKYVNNYLNSGVYFYTLKIDDYSQTKKMILLK